MRARLKIATLVAVLFSISATGPAFSDGQLGRTPPNAIDAARPGPSSARSTHWTRSRMREAKPLPLPKVNLPKAARPPRHEQALNRNLKSGATKAGNVRSGVARYSGNIYRIPLRWAGKLFFNKPGDVSGQGWVCSAQFISPTVILTAAHCVRDPKTGQFYRNFSFRLQYRDGTYSNDYGWRCAATKHGWIGNDVNHYDYDYAMILTNSRSSTGWFGTEWNWRGKFNSATKIGYPRGLMHGQVIQVDSGPLSFADFDDNIVRLNHGKSAEQGGTSGGAWVPDFLEDRAGGDHIISVSSFTQGNIENIIYGPYFTDDFPDLFKYVSRGCQQ